MYNIIINKINYSSLIYSNNYDFNNNIEIYKSKLNNKNIIKKNEFKEIDDNLFDDYDIDLIELSKK